jgi:hypothetical protein
MVVGFLAASTLVAEASAQTAPGLGWALDRYDPSPAGDGMLLAESTAIPGYNYLDTGLHVWAPGSGRSGFLLVTINTTSEGARRRTIALRRNGRSFDVVWSAPDADAGAVLERNDFVANSLSDLDGVGGPEFVRATRTNGGLEILDAQDGSVRVSRPELRLRAVVNLDLNADGTPTDNTFEVLASDPDGVLAAYDYHADGLVRRWQIPGGWVPLFAVDPGLRRVSPHHMLPVLVQADADEARELVLRQDDATGNTRILSARNVTEPPTETATYSPPNGTIIASSRVGTNVTRSGSQLMVVRNDGYLIVLDSSLRPTNVIEDSKVPVLGMRVGGRFLGLLGSVHTPIVATMANPTTPTNQPRVLTETSRGSVVCLNAIGTVGAPPSVLWERPGAQFPTAVNLDNDPSLEVILEEGLGARDLVAVDSDGRTELWRTRLPQMAVTQTLPRNNFDPLPGDANGDGTPDLMVAWEEIEPHREVVNIFDGRTGQRLWTEDATTPSSLYGVAFADVTGDRRADALLGHVNLHLHDSVGRRLASYEGRAGIDGTPAVTDLNGDGQPDVWLAGFNNGSGSTGGIVALNRDLTVRWTSTDSANHYQARGTAVRCADGGARIVVGGFSLPQFWIYNGADGRILSEGVLAGGRVFRTLDDASAAGVYVGVIGNFSGAENLSGAGHPTALTGSTDGHLYALNPCARDQGSMLEWSLNLGSFVSEPIVADSDDDGRLDVLVSTADGYLHGIGQQVLPAPANVRDRGQSVPLTDGGIDAGVEEDIDEIDTISTLYASWNRVPGATRYEVAVYTIGGVPLRTPPYSNVGDVDRATINDLRLRQGSRYRVDVRAVGANGPGTEGRSDGVLVADRTPPVIDGLTVTPARFSPRAGESLQISFQTSDRGGLGSYTVTIERAGASDGGGVTRRLTSGRLTGNRYEGRASWDGRGEDSQVVPDGDYDVRLTAEDTCGRRVERLARITVATTLTMPPDAGDAGTNIMDGGTSGPASSGCGCRTRGARASSALWIGLGLALVRRRRRRTETRHRSTTARPRDRSDPHA